MTGEKMTTMHAPEQSNIRWEDYPIFTVCGGDSQCRQALEAYFTSRNDLRVCYWKERDGKISLFHLLQQVACHDMVVLEAEPEVATHCICLDGFAGGKTDLPGDCETLVCSMTAVGIEIFSGQLNALLTRLLMRIPVWACLLIGGKSSRMGSPKHLLQDNNGKRWLANMIAVCRELAEGIVIAGQGEVPPEYGKGIYRVPDAPGIVGPMAGIISCGRWLPRVSWLLLACDMPNCNTGAGKWLLSGRRPGCWGRIPRLPGSNRLDPLFAWYDFRALSLFEDLSCRGERRMRFIAGRPEIETVQVPEQYAEAWINVNTPEQLRAHLAK